MDFPLLHVPNCQFCKRTLGVCETAHGFFHYHYCACIVLPSLLMVRLCLCVFCVCVDHFQMSLRALSYAHVQTHSHTLSSKTREKLNWKSRCWCISGRRFSDRGKVWMRRCFLGRQSLLVIISENNRTESRGWVGFNKASERMDKIQNHGTHLKSLDT